MLVILAAIAIQTSFAAAAVASLYRNLDLRQFATKGAVQ
jgi:hypothetical protein